MLYADFNAKFYTVEKIHDRPTLRPMARQARSPVHLHMRMRSSVHLGARAHPG